VPGSHSVQFPAAPPFDARPIGQAVQLTEASFEEVPGLQAEQTVAPISLPVADPAGQLVQSPTLAVCAYLPAVHHSQELTLNKYVPEGQYWQVLRSGALNLVSLH
jgi:hypothetical protein